MRKTLKKIHPYFLCICLLSSIFYAVAISQSIDSDVLWHFKLGEEIVKTGKISLQDTFSWQEGLSWPQQEWLYDLMIYAIVALFQMPGFLLLTVVFKTIAFYATGMASEKDRITFIGWIFLMMATIPSNWGNRPAEFSGWAYPFAIWMWRKCKNHGTWQWLILAVFLANFHWGSILSLVILLVILAVTEIFSDWREGVLSKGNTIHSLCPALFVFAGSFVCPSPGTMWKISMSLTSWYTTSLIQEWQPWEMVYLQAVVVAFIVLVMGYGLCKGLMAGNRLATGDAMVAENGLMAGNGITARVSIQDTAVVCAFLVATIVSCKSGTVLIPILLFCCPQYLDMLLSDIFTKVGQKQEERDKKVDLNSAWAWRPQPIAALLCTIAISVLFCMSMEYTGSFTEYADAGYSETVLEAIEALPEGSRLLNAYSDGNVLLYHDVKVFVDTRQFPYAAEWGNGSLDDLYLAFTAGWDEFAEFMDEYEIDYIFVTQNFDIYDELAGSGEWNVLVEDGEAGQSLWVRKAAQDALSVESI